MAVIMNDAAYMGFPLSIKRGNPAPVDTTAVWYNKTELETYAKSGATAYVGQVLTLVADGKCEAYMISNEAGTLIKLASTTASGDLASDVATLQTQVEGLLTKVGAPAGDGVASTGIYSELDNLRSRINGKVGSVSAGAGIEVSGDATAPSVAVKVDTTAGNALTIVDGKGLRVEVPDVVHPEYTVEKLGSASEGAVASYALKKDGTQVGATIDIPKDLVVVSGSVVELKAGALPAGVTEPGTYIELVLSGGNPIYIPVGSLIEYVTGGSGEDDAIQINVDGNTHKVTASVKAGSLTKDMLASGVQTSLGKADSAVQAIATGSANGNISVDGTDVPVKGLASAAFETVDNLNATAQTKAETEAGKVKNELLGTTSDDASSETIRGAIAAAASAKSEAIADAKAKIEALDLTDKAVAGEFVTEVKQTDGQISVARAKLGESDIPALPISKITNLQDTLDGKQANLTFDGTYGADNAVATVSTVESAKAAVVGVAADTSDKDTVKGAKAYADAAAEAAKKAAKEYADSIVSGDDGVTARVTALEGKVDVAKVSEAIATAKSGAIDAAKTETTSQVSAATEAILGEAGYTHTVKDAYVLASGKATMAEVEAKDYATKTEAQGYADAKDAAIAAAKKAGDDAATAAQAAQDTADAKVASVKATADLGIVVAGTATAPTIGVKVDPVAGNALSVSASGLKVTIPSADTYGLVKDETAGDYAAVYHLTKNGANFGDAINIPKDMVVSSGTVETNPTGKPAGTYLVLVLANATSDKIYIPVDSLIEYVTSGSSATDMVVVDVSDDHKVTATITDGKITLAKLDSGVQASLGKADSALQAADAPGYDDILTKTEAGTTYVAQEANKRLMTSDEGTKLEGIEAQATKNSIKLNGAANANPEFYAPTTAGTAGQVLMASGDGAPTWSAMPKSFIKFVQKNPALTPASGKATWTIGASAHGIVAEDIMVQLFEVATGEQVFADVVVSADKSVKITMNASATVVANTYKAVLFG